MRNLLGLITVFWLCVLSQLLSADSPPDSIGDRLDFEADVVGQFVAYAQALDIDEKDITRAIFEGRFVPDPDDLQLVLLRLSDTTCSDDFGRLAADDLATPGEFLSYNCATSQTIRLGVHHQRWIDRFGAAPSQVQFALASRLYYVLTRNRPDPVWTTQPYEVGGQNKEAQETMEKVAVYAAPYYFLWSSAVSNAGDFSGNYRKMRSEFLRDLPTKLSSAEAQAIGLVSDTEAIDALGQDWPGSTLQVFLHGDKERLLWTWRAQLVMQNNLDPFNWRQAVMRHGYSNGPSFFDTIAIWGIARHAELGACGDRTTTLIHTVTPVTDYFRGGIFEQRIEGLSTRSEFTALSDFADAIVGAPSLLRGDASAFEGIAQRLGCDNRILKGLEANMIAHLNGQALPFRMLD